MTPIELLLFKFEELKKEQDVDITTLDKCIKAAEALLPKEIWELHRQYDEGWIGCLNDKNM